MTILATKKSWRKSGEPRGDLAPDLTTEEYAAVRRALVFLRARHGDMPKLAAALRVRPSLLARAFGKAGKPSAGLALRVARLAGTSVESVLGGTWPPEGACPHCGRS